VWRSLASDLLPYHLGQVDLRHWCRRDLLVELPPRVGHVAGGPRAHRAREADANIKVRKSSRLLRDKLDENVRL
jgi:hypothetical protein